METPSSIVQQLVRGPRGRRLCAELLGLNLAHAAGTQAPGWTAKLRNRASRELDEVFSGPDPEREIFEALTMSVATARYYQDPDWEDELLAGLEVAELLEPVAVAIAEHPSTQWWSTGIEVGTQAYTTADWVTRPRHFDEPMSERLHQLRATTLDDNSRMQLYRRSEGEARWANTSGSWWSTPGSTAPLTTRTHHRFGPIGLSLAEDDTGGERARSWSIPVDPGARIFEVASASSWADLVRRYPEDVTYSRGANWLQATGRDGAWVIPDWLAVSSDYDAVHLTVAGYLDVSGRVIEVDDGVAAFLAAWGPDETYWLADLDFDETRPTRWLRTDDDEWTRAESPSR